MGWGWKAQAKQVKKIDIKNYLIIKKKLIFNFLLESLQVFTTLMCKFLADKEKRAKTGKCFLLLKANEKTSINLEGANIENSQSQNFLGVCQGAK